MYVERRVEIINVQIVHAGKMGLTKSVVRARDTADGHTFEHVIIGRDIKCDERQPANMTCPTTVWSGEGLMELVTFGNEDVFYCTGPKPECLDDGHPCACEVVYEQEEEEDGVASDTPPPLLTNRDE